MLSSQFIKAGNTANRYDSYVSAPWFRKKFTLDSLPAAAKVTVGTPGFYRAFVNGHEITKGPLAPYISNPDHILYYDEYEITSLLAGGENVLVILAGNGNLSSPGGSVWDFEKFPWTDAQKVAFCLDFDGQTTEADGSVKCAPSHIYFDDLRAGERHDGSLYDENILLPGFDDSAWECALPAFATKGERKLCTAHPVSFLDELKGEFTGIKECSGDYRPHKKACGDGGYEMTPAEEPAKGSAYVFDFGVNTAGIPVMTVTGRPGQRLELQFAEYIDADGKVNWNNIDFFPDGYSQRDVFICSGRENEKFEPYFTYHGARYCAVFGLDEETLPSFSVSLRRISTVTERLADFSCSDENAVKLFNMCVNSDASNFVYFPTDCPQREKNGWTGDAANSSERMAMFYDVYDDYREWMNNIRKAQNKDGLIPCIIPTDTWGTDGCGPSWEKAIAMIPWNAYRFTGRKEILEENCEAVYSYLKYLESSMDRDGLIKHDLGDWLPVNHWKKAHEKVCAAASASSACDCAASMFGVLGRDDYAEFAKGLKARLIYALRRHFVNPITAICDNGGQSAQSLAIMRGIFKEEETEKAVKNLVAAVENDGEHISYGLQGATALLPCLFENGFADLAWKLIMRDDFPSYKHFIDQGLTSIPENFFRDDLSDINSLNHHMFGNIAQFMVQYVAGLRPSFDVIHIEPCYVKALEYAEAGVMTDRGEVRFRWERMNDGSILNVLTAPEGTNITCGETEGKFIVNGKEADECDRKGYQLFS